MPYLQHQIPLYYEDTGEGENLIFLNGILMNTEAWKLQKKYFRKNYRCLLHDFRDQLQSGRSEQSYDLTAHVEDLRALFSHWQVSGAHLVGTSYGGEVGMMFAYTYPELTRSLTVIASVSEIGPLLRRQVDLWKAIALQHPSLLYEAVASLSFSDDFLSRFPQLITAGAERLATYPPDFFTGFARLCDAFLTLDIIERLAGIECPTLFIAAEKDILKTPEYSRRMQAALPGSQLSVIPGAGHAVVLEQPRMINQLIAGFISERH